jgi:hypothetical protein
MFSLLELEQKRLTKLRQVRTYLNIGTILFFLNLFLITVHVTIPMFVTILGILAMAFLGINVIRSRQFSTDEERAVFMETLSGVWGKDVSYEPAGGFGMAQVCSTNLFRYFGRNDDAILPGRSFSSRDMVTAHWNDISFAVADVQLSYSPPKKETGYVVLGTQQSSHFDGILIRAQYPLDFEGETWVQPRNRDSPSPISEPVRLESSEFEQVYKTYSTDQMGARMALQTDTMIALIALKNKIRSGAPRLFFAKNEVWIALETGSQWLDINLSKPIAIQQQETKELLKQVCTLLLELKLHQPGNRLVNLK